MKTKEEFQKEFDALESERQALSIEFWKKAEKDKTLKALLRQMDSILSEQNELERQICIIEFNELAAEQAKKKAEKLAKKAAATK